MSIPRHNFVMASTAIVRGKETGLPFVLALGGSCDIPFNYQQPVVAMDAVECWDGDGWQAVPSMPVGRERHGAALLLLPEEPEPQPAKARAAGGSTRKVAHHRAPKGGAKPRRKGQPTGSRRANHNRVHPDKGRK